MNTLAIGDRRLAMIGCSADPVGPAMLLEVQRAEVVPPGAAHRIVGPAGSVELFNYGPGAIWFGPGAIWLGLGSMPQEHREPGFRPGHPSLSPNRLERRVYGLNEPFRGPDHTLKINAEVANG